MDIIDLFNCVSDIIHLISFLSTSDAYMDFKALVCNEIQPQSPHVLLMNYLFPLCTMHDIPDLSTLTVWQ